MRTLARGAAFAVASVSIGLGSTAAASTYTVRAGDTLTGIAARHGTTVGDLARLNGLPDPDRLAIGQVLAVPTAPGTTMPSAPSLATQAGPGGLTYVVQPGDTVFGIARRFGVTPAALATANGLANPNLIHLGQVLRIPVTPAPGPLLPTVPTLPPDAGAPVAPLTPPPATTTTTPAPPAPATYTVVAGDTLFSIARRYGTTVATLTQLNGIAQSAPLRIGQVLVLPSAPVPPTTTTTTPPAGPTAPATATSLPRSLFGNAATDPARLALVPSFDRWADHYRVPRDLMKGMAFVESSWRKDALSPSGAMGVGQFMPDTARWVAATLIGDPTLDPWKPDDNIRMMGRYLRYLIDVTGNETNAIASYYQGWGSLQRDGVKPATVTYLSRVDAARAHFR